MKISRDTLYRIILTNIILVTGFKYVLRYSASGHYRLQCTQETVLCIWSYLIARLKDQPVSFHNWRFLVFVINASGWRHLASSSTSEVPTFSGMVGAQVLLGISCGMLTYATWPAFDFCLFYSIVGPGVSVRSGIMWKDKKERTVRNKKAKSDRLRPSQAYIGRPDVNLLSDQKIPDSFILSFTNLIDQSATEEQPIITWPEPRNTRWWELGRTHQHEEPLLISLVWPISLAYALSPSYRGIMCSRQGQVCIPHSGHWDIQASSREHYIVSSPGHCTRQKVTSQYRGKH